MRPIFYTAVNTVPHGGQHYRYAAGAQSNTLAAIVRHAHRIGYELVPFVGWAAEAAAQARDNQERITDLLDTLEITRVVGLDPDNPQCSQYFPQILDWAAAQEAMDDDEGMRIVRIFTETGSEDI